MSSTKPFSGADPASRNTEVSLNRRSLLSKLTAAGGAAALCCGQSFTAAAETSADAEPSGASLKAGDHFTRVGDGAGLSAIRLSDLPAGAAIMDVMPLDPATGKAREESRMNAVNLVRISNVPSGSPLEATQGVMAYSAICTHKGCKVNSWAPEQNRWRCFCHMSEFDVLANGEVVDGPATQPLPTIPIAIDAEGIITATAGFSSAPGAAD
ncbi:MAG: Rieske (2Fe-2S) protein [Hyphomicrobium sp.]|nr:Rieske (2Fe-2S) protein [Hyphomicrobium sp.]